MMAWQFLVDHPRFVPSFFVFCILLVLGDSYVENAQRRPKLHRVTPLFDIIKTAAGGKFDGIAAEVGENEFNHVEIDEQLAILGDEDKDGTEGDVEDNYDFFTKKKEKEKKRAAAEAKAARELALKEAKVTSVKNIFSLNALNPMSLILGPLQIVLKGICIQLRTYNNLFSWKDPFVSFWTTAVTFVLWVVLLIFPYRFFFYWFFRISGLLILGPQNAGVWWYAMRKKKLADVSRLKTDEEKFRALELGCHVCKKEFGLLNRKHHCRACGEVVCGNCSLNKKVVKVSLWGNEMGKVDPKKKKRVCDLCFRGEKIVLQHKVEKVIAEAGDAYSTLDNDENILMEGLNSIWGVTKTAGMGLAKGTELVGTGLVKGTVAVGTGLVEGTVEVTKGTGNILLQSGKAVGDLFTASKYGLEVPVTRVYDKRFIDRPVVGRSFSRQVTTVEQEDERARRAGGKED